MIPQAGDVVMVTRPKLPSRVGKVVRIGKKVYVKLPRVAKPKRYALASVTTLVRTRVSIRR